ncbi:MAG: hypothetical protein KC476_06965 [Cyanobacteria bacterium HKST-UBA06]|nr:hypothetical protein [Cyanobacteria bacterium HKST-UBA04]MCA9807680.1 hypothetical protein [Cyanobacteria bacterium HKST-UBA06]MCA9841119.1 hypothetical protein [Cyanobacteria bacterium HKST-UBA03]
MTSPQPTDVSAWLSVSQSVQATSGDPLVINPAQYQRQLKTARLLRVSARHRKRVAADHTLWQLATTISKIMSQTILDMLGVVKSVGR